MKASRLLAFTAAALAVAGPALAHPGHDHAATFATGFAHPLGGLDHLLAMVSVGLWAALRGGRAAWAWPLAFVVAMAFGGVLGVSGISTSLAEPLILASVIILGVMVAAAVRAPVLAGAALVGVFGLAHGLAHGAEAPAGSPLAYAVGFLAATALLHLAGLAAGAAANSGKACVLLRFTAIGAALAGVAMVFS